MDKDKPSLGIQEFLSVGYLYLVVMGILNQTIFYNQLGINILNYSSIIDVLITPISILTSSIISLFVFSTLILLVFVLPVYLVKKKETDWVQKQFKIDSNSSDEEIQTSTLKTLLFLLSLGLFGFFIGTSIGGGGKISSKIQKGEIEYNDQIQFINGGKSVVSIVGTNSTYVFYLVGGNKKIQITPINGIIKSMENNND